MFRGRVMETLGKWGIFIVVPQTVLGGVIYVISILLGIGEVEALGLAFAAAGAVAVVCSVVSMFYDDVIAVLLAVLALLIVLAALCIANSAYFLTGISSFVIFALAVVAAKLATESEKMSEGAFFLVVLNALPPIGALMYFFLSDGKKAKV